MLARDANHLIVESNVLASIANQPTSQVKKPSGNVYKVTSPSDTSEGLVKHLIVIPKW